MNKKNSLGLIISFDNSLIFLSKYGHKKWHEMFKVHNLNEKYKNTENYEMFCYLEHMKVDAVSFFLEKIKKIEQKNKTSKK